MKKIFIAGVDGYLGWALAQYLAAKGFTVTGLDDCRRRDIWVPSCGSTSAIPIASLADRISVFKEQYGDHQFAFSNPLNFKRNDGCGDVANYETLCRVFEAFGPDAIVNLAQMASAPYSMKSFGHAFSTYNNNIGTTMSVLWAVRDTCQHVPIITIGTAGEYGTPGIKITEGDVEIGIEGRTAKLPFPKTPASLYHASKVASTVIYERACAWWNLAATDVMQGVVYGAKHEHMTDRPEMATRLDFDQCFGTCLQRFVVQTIIGHPLTVYGSGAQQRAFLPLRDSMRCLQLLIENPPEPGKVRIVNQYDQVYSINELALAVECVAKEHGITAFIEHIENPRWEIEDHYYEMERKKLVQLGYEPKGELHTEVHEMFEALLPHKERLEGYRYVINPTVTWDKGQKKSPF
ncbi:MAG: NAD-dependent epimerase/dehydratase family protein [Planctomycetota bacterium]|jgi:UDP-sulfoquinovose synthase